MEKTVTKTNPVDSTASDFIEALALFKSEKELDKVDKFFKGDDGKTKAFGAKFGDVFNLAKEFKEMPLEEVERLLDSDFYEVRMGAVSILDFKAQDKKITESERKTLFDFYIKHHDRLNNWDFVDRAAVRVIGEYLLNKPKDILYKLAKSKDPWERRTAIVSTYAFIKKGNVEDTFRIAEILIYDKHELINKAVGSWIRVAGEKNREQLCEFLEKYASTMPRTTLRYAIEKLSEEERKYYMNKK